MGGGGGAHLYIQFNPLKRSPVLFNMNEYTDTAVNGKIIAEPTGIRPSTVP